MKILFTLLLAFNVMAFGPIEVETQDYKNRVTKEWRSQNDPKFCRVLTRQSSDGQSIELRLGVVGSPISYFGWNAPIAMEDFPLVDGFYKEYKSLGQTTMVMTYKDSVLKFEPKEDAKIWNRIYRFELTVDSNLRTPTRLETSLLGYERNLFGKLKKHIVQKCKFD